jgi:hypothetical protein
MDPHDDLRPARRRKLDVTDNSSSATENNSIIKADQSAFTSSNSLSPPNWLKLNPHQRASLGNLPADVAALVMEHLDSLDDVFSLAATCRGFNNVLKTCVPGVFRNVAPRCIKQLSMAHKLVSTQFGTRIPDDSESASSSGHLEITTVAQLRTLWLNARHMESARDAFASIALLGVSRTMNLVRAGQIPDATAMTAYERGVFELTYYTFSCLGEVCRKGFPNFHTMREMMQKFLRTESIQRLLYLDAMNETLLTLDSHRHVLGLEGPESDPKATRHLNALVRLAREIEM